MSNNSSSNNITIAPAGDGRFQSHKPFTGPGSDDRIIHEAELEKLCNFHKEVVASRSYFKDLWLTALSVATGHFVSSGTTSFSGQRPAMDSGMLCTFIFSFIVYIKALLAERECIKNCDSAIKTLRETVTSRRAETIESAGKNNQSKGKNRSNKPGRQL
jgi:hypothetical protein